MPLSITSPRFRHGKEIPVEYTCDGDDISPPLVIAGIPKGTQSLALILEDPDAPDPSAPGRIFIHWLLFNMPPTIKGLPEGVENGEIPEPTQYGRTDFGHVGYGGPCPPIGRHRYFFRLFALDTVLTDMRQPNREQLLEAMEGHILAQAELMGTYESTSSS